MQEKTLNEAASENRSLYQNACSLSGQGNWDQAIAQFNLVLVQEPGLVECREALRKAQLARFQKRNGFAHAIDEVRELPELAEAEIYLHSKPLKAMNTAELALNRIPTSLLAHKIFAEAALKNGLFRSASLSLEYIRKHGGTEDIDVNLELANALAESGQVSRGLTICGRLLKENPENRRVTRTLERLSKLAFGAMDTPRCVPRSRPTLQRQSASTYPSNRLSGIRTNK